MTTLHCSAKANLFLAIRGKDASGYHEIETVLVRLPEEVATPDLIHLEPASELTLAFQPAFDIDPKNNTLTKAIHLLEQKTGRRFTYKITVEKNIPPGSGLGGGSSDAASLLLHLNEVEKLGLSREELLQLGAQVGMDVPFFLSGYEVALGTHYGEKIAPLNALPKNLKLRIEFTPHKVSTQEAYARWDAEPRPPAPTPKLLLAALQHGHVDGILSSLHNDFEQITPQCEPYSKTRHLCGSGSAVFWLNPSSAALQSPE